MNLTKREALEKTIHMWTWLSEHPSVWTNEDDYFINQKIKDKDIPTQSCYCCEYATNDQNYCNCACCPIWSNTEGVFGGCLNEGSPYCDWLCTTAASERQKSAFKIVKLAQEALDELDKEN